MKNDNGRRLFFKQMASSVSDLVNRVISPDHDHPEHRTQMCSEIMGDLTPELLSMEAQRLGLDPKEDPRRVYQEIQAAMQKSGTKESRMR